MLFEVFIIFTHLYNNSVLLVHYFIVYLKSSFFLLIFASSHVSFLLVKFRQERLRTVQVWEVSSNGQRSRRII